MIHYKRYARSPLERRKRASKPKVKTGCLTCRTRRIKCDEGKPSCNKCEISGWTCEYVHQAASIEEHKDRCTNIDAKKPALLPKPPIPTSNTSDNKRVLAHGHIRLPTPPRDRLFSNEQEANYFRLFSTRVTHQLSGYFHSDIWSQLILQAAENDPSIRHVIVAIGALDVTLTLKRRPYAAKNAALLNQHHQFALEQYSKAIKRISKLSNDGGQDLRTRLLTCLIIYAFETLHGNHESALALVHTGLRMLEDWCREHTTAVSDSNSSSSFHTFSTQKQIESRPQSSSNITFGIISPRPLIIESSILQAFGRLDMQCISFIDTRPLSYHTAASSAGSTTLLSLPPTFTTTSIARTYWELIMRRLMHWISSQKESPTIPGGILNRNMAGGTTVPLSPIYNLIKEPDSPSYPNLCDEKSQTALLGQQKHLTEVKQWARAYFPLFKRTRETGTTDPDFCAANVLRLRWLAAFIALSSALSPSQMIFDKFLPQFREIVLLARILLSQHNIDDGSDGGNGPGTFTFDLGFIAQLYVVGIRCRESSIRREAIALLLSRSWREGVWDSSLAGRMARVVCEIEEEGGGEVAAGLEPEFVLMPVRTSCLETGGLGGRKMSFLGTDDGGSWVMGDSLQDVESVGGHNQEGTSKEADSEVGDLGVPEHKRVIGTRVKFNLCERTARVICTVGRGAGAKILERQVSW